MSIDVIVVDQFGLVALQDLVDPADTNDLFEIVSQCFSQGTLRAPREVFDEISHVQRGTFLAGWVTGLGQNRNQWVPDIGYQRPVMGLVASVGFKSGFETLDGRDPTCSDVARLCFELQGSGLNFAVLSTDTGNNPLAPTMEQLCSAAGWKMIDAAQAAAHLDLLA